MAEEKVQENSNVNQVAAQPAAEESSQPISPEEDSTLSELDAFKKIAKEESSIKVVEALKSNPQFITQSKTLQEKAERQAGTEILAEVQSGRMSTENAQAEYQDRVEILYKQLSDQDEKINKIKSKAEQSIQEEYQQRLGTYLTDRSAKFTESRKAGVGAVIDQLSGIPGVQIAGKFLTGTVVGQAISETFESTIPKEFASMELLISSSRLESLKKQLAAKENPQLVKRDRATPHRANKSEEELREGIQKELGVTTELLSEIKTFEDKLSKSDLERDLITAFETSFGDGINAIGAMAGDQIARLPTMLVGGGFVSEAGNIYYDNIKAIAEKDKISPLEVIEQGKDEKALALASGTISAALEYTGLGKVASIVAKGVKSQVKKKVVDMLSATAVESATETAQGAVAQVAESIAVDENRIDYADLGKQALAGGTMGLVMFGAGTGATSTFSRSYVLNDQSITRAAARKLIEEGDVEGLTIKNDPFLEDKLQKEYMTETDLVDKTKTIEDIRTEIAQDENLSDLEVEKAVKEVEQQADRIADKFKISKEKALANVNLGREINTKENNEPTEQSTGEQPTAEQDLPGNPTQPDTSTQPDTVTEQSEEGSAGTEGVPESTKSEESATTEVAQPEDAAGLAQEQEVISKEDKIKQIRDSRAEIITRLNNSSRESLRSGIDPEVFKEYVQLAKTYIDEGVVRFKDFSAKFKADVKDRFGVEVSNDAVKKAYESANRASERDGMKGTVVYDPKAAKEAKKNASVKTEEQKLIDKEVDKGAKNLRKAIDKKNEKPKKKRKDMTPEERTEADIIKTTKSLKSIIEEATGVKKEKPEEGPTGQTTSQMLKEEEGIAKRSRAWKTKTERELRDAVDQAIADPKSKVTKAERTRLRNVITSIINANTEQGALKAKERLKKMVEGKDKTLQEKIDEVTGVKKEKAPTKEQTTADMLRADVKTSKEAKQWVSDNQKIIEDLLIKGMKESNGKIKMLGIRRIKQVTNAIIKAPASSLEYKKQVSKLLDMLSRQGVENYKASANVKRKAIQKRKNQLRGFEEPVRRILNIDPSDVPINRRTEYNQILSTLSTKGIPDSNLLYRIGQVADLMEQVSLKNAYVKDEVAGYMGERIREAENNKETLKNEELIDGVMDDLKIEDLEDRRIYRNYLTDNIQEFKKAANLKLKEGKTETLTISKEEADIDLAEALEISKNLDPMIFGDIEIAKRVQDFKNVKTEDLFDLDRREVANYLKIVRGLDLGIVPYRFNSFHNKIRARRMFNELKASVSTLAEIPKMINIQKAIENNRSIKLRKNLANKMSKAHIQNIEYMIGKIKGNKVYTTLISPLSRGMKRSAKENETISSKLASMFEEGYGGLRNKENIEANILMNMVMTEREYLLNPDNRTTHSVDDHMKSMVVSSVAKETKDKYLEVLGKYSEAGKFDLGKAEAKLRDTKLKKKKTIDGIEIENAEDILSWMRKTLDNDTRKKAQHVKNYIEDEAFASTEGYFPQKAFQNEAKSLEEVLKSMDGANDISVKSGNLEKRQKAANPIVFNAYANFENAVRSINTHYHLSKPIAESNATLSLMARVGDEQTKEIASALRETLSKTVAIEINGFDSMGPKGNSIINHILNKTFQKETLQTLASVYKTVGELAANIISTYKLDRPRDVYSKGRETRGKIGGGLIREFMNRSGSVQEDRVGRASDEREFKNSINKKRLQSKESNPWMNAYVKAFEGQALNAISGFVENVNKKIVSAGDSALVEPIWWSVFKNDFESKTGESITIETVLDPEFEVKYNREIEESRGIADRKTSLVINTGSSFETALRDKQWKRNALYKYGTFLKGFSTNEAFIMKDAFSSLLTKDSGSMGKDQAIRAITSQLASQAVYSVIRYQVANIGLGIITDAFDLDSPEEKDAKDYIGRIVADLILTNTIGHWHTALTAGLIFAISEASQTIEEKYDVNGVSDYIFKPSLTYTPQTLKALGGPVGVAAGSLMDAVTEGTGSVNNIAQGDFSRSDLNAVIPLMRITTGLPIARDVENVIKLIPGMSDNKKKKKKGSSIKGSVFDSSKKSSKSVFDSSKKGKKSIFD